MNILVYKLKTEIYLESKCQVLACGDVRGNMVLFPLLKNLVLSISDTEERKIPPVNNFKGVHGISSVSSVSVTKLGYNQLEIRSVCSTFLL